MIDYGEAIKNIFKNKKRNTDNSTLNPKSSIKSQENTSSRIKQTEINENLYKKESKTNNKNNINNNSKELRIINDDDDLKNINIDYKKFDLNDDGLIFKLKKELKEKNGNSFININESKEKNFSNNKKIKNKKKELIKKSNNENGANENLLLNENDSNFNLNSFQNNIKYQIKNNLISLKKKNSKIKNHFEQYNTKNLAYNAIKNYSNCKPKEKDFLSRMEFYSVKKHIKPNLIDLIVKDSTPKIRESDKIITFNRLIEDANRRLENKNNIYINDNVYYDNSLNKKINEKKKKKFNQIEFENKYKENITERLQKKEIKLELLRQQKNKENKAKEDIIVKQMKKRNKRASKKEIERISNRLYNESSNRIKKHIYNSLNEIEENLQNNLNEIQNQNENDNKRKINISPKRKFGHNNLILKNDSTNKLIRKKKYNRTHNYSNNNYSINSFNFSKPKTYRKVPISYKQQFIKKMKKNVSLDDNSNLINDNKNNKNKIVPYYTAEKMIDNFFNNK